ncbi:unnamed protein product [Prorocentrum cordatum]|uniref:PDZ domain-containing protein n=1 Tax=Prorocentrum cordatum TaxID=2364126 RepID=A0ABN9Q0F4_9DINO|nr:unnamed protein product [Polarella glacialis]|mmetsp:Transcript_75464/g.196757  ORF Transcript_75464/g.196757 Transcript_75464/m.196757 type:complete len:200 (+) Transcript_75464:70-669(+)
MARSTSLLSPALVAALAVVACRLVLGAVFVGAPAVRGLRGQAITRRVGTDYLLRNGPRDADGPPVDTAAAPAGQSVEYKKRPFGIARYAPGVGGNGATVMEVTQKSRYPGDPQGQAFVAGVQPGWSVKTVNGQDVTGLPFGAIMEMLDDEVLDPVAALSLNVKGDASQSSGSTGMAGAGMTDFGVSKAEVPITVLYSSR